MVDFDFVDECSYRCVLGLFENSGQGARPTEHDGVGDSVYISCVLEMSVTDVRSVGCLWGMKVEVRWCSVVRSRGDMMILRKCHSRLRLPVTL